jgi:hypothetical protein
MGFKIDAKTEAKLRAEGVIVGGYAAVAPIEERISEKEFQRAVTDLMKRHGWKYHHQTISRKSAAGWPDLVACRERIIFVELKTETGTLEAEQANWRDRIIAAGGEWYCFRPSDWAKIVEVLT